MRKLLLPIGFLLALASASGQQSFWAMNHKVSASKTWTLVQYAYYDSYGDGSGSNCTSTGSSCTTNLSTPVAAGDKLIIATQIMSSSEVTLSSISGETLSPCSSCTSYTRLTSSMGYVLSATGGETSITCYLSGAATSYNVCLVFDFHYTGSSASYDTAANDSISDCPASCTGPSLTLSGSNDAVVQITSPSAWDFTSITAPYTLFGDSAAGVGVSSGAAPTWTAAGGNGIVQFSILALKGN